MKQKQQQEKGNKKEYRCQQLTFPMSLKPQISQDAPVRLLAEILDQMNYGKLERAAAKEGKNGNIPARVKSGILVFGAMNEIYSSRKLETSAGTMCGTCGCWRDMPRRITAPCPGFEAVLSWKKSMTCSGS